MNALRGLNPMPEAGLSQKDWDLMLDAVSSSRRFVEGESLALQSARETQALQGEGLLANYRGEFEAARKEAYAGARQGLLARLAEVERESKQALEGALAVEVEINTQVRERILAGQKAEMKNIDFEAEVRKGYEFWPFEGEFWRDETGGYAFATSDVCGTTNQNAAGAR
jgi:hypothetical protein